MTLEQLSKLRKTCPARRVAVSVVCAAMDVPGVQQELREWFENSEYPLVRYRNTLRTAQAPSGEELISLYPEAMDDLPDAGEPT